MQKRTLPTCIGRSTAGGADLRFRTRFGNSNVNLSTVDASLTDDTLLDDFIMVAGVVDPASATEKMRLYVNGVKVGTINGFADWQDGTNDVGLGRIASALGGSGSGGFFNGDVAILRLYDEPLSDADVLARWLEVTFVPPNEAEAVPEPTTVVIAALGLLGMGGLAWRRRKRA